MSKLQKKDFTGNTIYVGLDVHKKTWHSTIIFGDVENKKSFSASPEDLCKYLNRTYPGAKFKLAYEAGYSGFWIYDELNDKGIETIVVNPADIPTTDKHYRTRTDKIDSRKIARTLKSNMLLPIYVPPKQQREDRALVRHRHNLVVDQTRVKNRIKACLSFNGISYPQRFKEQGTHWSNTFLKWLESLNFMTNSGNATLKSYLRILRFIRSELLTITKQIRELSKTTTYEKNYKILITTPGIGLISAMTFLTEIGDISRFKDVDEFLSYIGIVPTENSSGEKKNIGKMNKRHNKYLKTIIIEASWIARRYDPSLAAAYNSALRRGSQTAIIKVCKKLVSRIHRILLYQETYIKGMA